MEGRLIREDERNVRSENFLTANSADFAAIPAATTKIPQMTAANAKVAHDKQNQIGGAGEMREHYDVYEDAYDEMIQEMETLRDFAAPIGQTVTGLESKFRIPRAGGKGAKIAAAHVFADDAEPIKQKFIDYGMPADFVTELRAKADAAKQGLDNAQASTGKKVGATGSLEPNVKNASAIVESISPIVRFVYRSNPSKLAEWEHASRVERHTSKPDKSKSDKPKLPVG